MFRRVFWILKFQWLLLFVCVLAFSADSQTSNSETAALESDKPLAREISANRTDIFQIDLSTNEYVKIIIEQRGVDVFARLTSADGKSLGDFDGEPRPDEIETIEYVAPSGGTYRLEVAARYPLLPAGKYEIRLAERRPASLKEKSRQEARELYREALRRFSDGKYREARASVDRVLEILSRERGAEDAGEFAALTQRARILDAEGKFDEAERLNRQILADREKTLGAAHPDVALTLNYLGLVHLHRENFLAALEFHNRALALREKIFGAIHPLVASSLINLGVVYDSLGDRLKAGEFYQRALKIQEQTVGVENLNVAVILNNLGKIYNDLEDYEKAEAYLARAGSVLEKLYAPDNPRIYESLINLAASYGGQGETEKAERLYRRILEFYEKTVGEKHPRTALVLYNLANLYAFRRDFARAEPLYRRALAIREDFYTTESAGVSEILSRLAWLYAEKGVVEQALKLQQRANEIDERLADLHLSVGSERQKLAFLGNLFGQVNQTLDIQTRFAPGNPKAAELAFAAVLRTKGRVLDAVSNNLGELRRRFTPPDRRLLDEFNGVSRNLAELALSGREENESNKDFQARIKLLNERREKLEDEISRRAAGFYEKRTPVTVEAVRALIPADAALIEFAVRAPVPGSSEPHYVAYILRNRGEIKWKDLGEVRQIDERLAAFRKVLRDPKSADVEQTARAADEKIMAPLRPSLGEAKHLLISPDGALNLIPFEALVDEKGNYLVENYEFTYLTSGRDLVRMQVAREFKTKPLIIANPVFGETTGAQVGKRESENPARDLTEFVFTPLTGTAQEARAIQAIYPDAVVLDGSAATESALKQAVAPQILHIATHGFFLAETLPKTMRGSKNPGRTANPLLRSGLALAGANSRRDGENDGILTALEASGLNLWGTKLVVLSACDTGLGEVRNGEGVYGLRRAFVLAGAETLVMSLWAVSDFVTRETMTGYYKNLKLGAGRGASLRAVQIEMLKRPARRHPFYWASFIQTGNWAKI